MNSREVEGIILSTQDYKDHDALVSILLEDEILTFIARGVHKQNAKNRRLIRPFSFVHLTLTGSKMPILTTGHILMSYYNVYENLTFQSVLNVLVDCLKRTTITSDMFTIFQSCLQAFHTNDESAYTWSCILIKEILKEEGISINVNGCVLCHRMDGIETISMVDGGFICRSCNHGRVRKYTKEELVMYRSLFVYTKNRTDEFVNMYNFTIDDFQFLVRWFMHHTNIHLRSFQFLQSIINL